jgi:membrane protease YdiL (CAAX protease family)
VLIPSSTPSGLVVSGASTFTFGLVAGALTMATGRVGGAMAAHVVLSGIAVWVTWPL